jgi:hypothetical protein
MEFLCVAHTHLQVCMHILVCAAAHMTMLVYVLLPICGACGLGWGVPSGCYALLCSALCALCLFLLCLVCVLHVCCDFGGPSEPGSGGPQELAVQGPSGCSSPGKEERAG